MGLPSPDGWPKAEFNLAKSEAAKLNNMSETNRCNLKVA